MKLVRLDTKKTNPAKDEVGVDVVIHPQMTVVLGAAGDLRDALIDAIAGIPRGIAAAAGEIDVGGVREDLNAESLARLGLSTDLDVVVRAGDLPRHDDLFDERTAARRAATVARDDARRALLRAEAAAQEARQRQAETSERLNELRAGGSKAAPVAESAAAARAEASMRLETTSAERIGLDEQIERLRDEQRAASSARAEARRAVAEASRSERAPDGSNRGGLEGQRKDLQRRIAALAGQDPAPALACVERVERARSNEPAPVHAALAFADTWRDLHQQLADLERSESDEQREARSRVDAARRAAVDAERDLRVSALPADAVAALEAAHSAVLDALAKTSARFSGARARLRLEELRTEERLALERLGFSRYADYMLSSSSRGVGAGKRAVLQSARVRVAEAEAEWQALGGDESRDARRAELLEQRAALAPRIALLLGHEPQEASVEQELRALRAAPSAGDPALAELRSVLSDVGVEVGDEVLGEEELVDLLRAWLDENARLGEHRMMLEADLRAIDDQLVGGGARAEPDDDERVRVPVEQAERDLADAERRCAEVVATIEDAERRTAHLHQQEEAARDQVAELDASGMSEERALALVADTAERLERTREEVAAADAEAERLRSELAEADDRLSGLIASQDAETAAAETAPPEEREELIEDIEWYLLARLAAQRAVGDAGSVPLVLDDTFRDLDVAEAVRVMESMERMSGAVQVIAVSDDRALSFWAEALGEERAGVISLRG